MSNGFTPAEGRALLNRLNDLEKTAASLGYEMKVNEDASPTTSTVILKHSYLGETSIACTVFHNRIELNRLSRTSVVSEQGQDGLVDALYVLTNAAPSIAPGRLVKDRGIAEIARLKVG